MVAPGVTSRTRFAVAVRSARAARRAIVDVVRTRGAWYVGEGTTMMTPVLDDGTLRWRCWGVVAGARYVAGCWYVGLKLDVVGWVWVAGWVGRLVRGGLSMVRGATVSP